jgi:hypothetical protein
MKFRGTCLMVFLALGLNAYAQAPDLKSASSFAVLAGTGVTSADAGTTIVGDVGSSPTPAVTGLLPIQVTGTLYTAANAVVNTAKGDLTAAYVSAAPPRACTRTLTGVDLGGLTLGPGVYCFSSSALLTGTLTLAGTGGSNDVWIFQIGSTLTTATGANVAFIGGASPCEVFWQIGSSATIQTGNNFAGTIMALTSITLDGGTLRGRALARNGAVTISSQETIINGCSGGGSGSGSTIVVSPVNSSILCDSTTSSITKTALVLLNGIPVPVGTIVTFTVTAGPDLGRSGTATTDASGKATFTFAAPFSITSLAGDTIVASATINNATVVSNTTFATCSGSPTGCLTAPHPTVTVLATTPGPPKEVVFSVRAAGGLFTVVVNTPPTTNATVVVAPFDQGTTLAVGVTAIKINQSASATVKLTVTDLCGHTTIFDPVFATITIPASKSRHYAARSHHQAEEFDFDHWEVARLDGIGRTEGIVFLQNDSPGVESLVIRVNGSQFRTQLSDGEAKKIDISSALFHGHNTVRVAAFGDRGSSVDLAIADGK